MKRILLLGSQHGDELLGEQLYAYIKDNYSFLLTHVTYKLANPKAHNASLRYVETDMNRSYGQSHNRSYEEKRAKIILKYINDGSFDIILDLHTTKCIQQPSLIVASLNQANRQLVGAFDIKHVVVMRLELVHHSLIGVCPKAISFEVHASDVNNSLLRSICESLERYVQNRVCNRRRYLYEVKDVILKSSIPISSAVKLKNFNLSKYGFYPILTGDNTYKRDTNYLGFKSNKRRLTRL